MADDALSAAKQLVGAPAAAIIAAVEQLRGLGAEVIDAPTQIRQGIASRAAALVNQQAQAQLRSTPVSALKAAVGKGTRLGKLESSQYRTVADIVAVSASALQSVSGVGPQSALEIHSAAVALASEVRAATSIRFDPQRRGPAETELLQWLIAARRADVEASAATSAVVGFAQQLGPLPDAHRATKRMRMAFSGRKDRPGNFVGLTVCIQ